MGQKHMNDHDISMSGDADLIASQAAMRRAADAARQVAIQTDTAIVVMQNGAVTRITAEELRKEKTEKGKTA
jgi:hypothetical protein